MKFSVLLPTRNRLQYLKMAVESVFRQNYDNWEIIISDNFSDEDIQGYIQSLNDPRIKYFRTASFIPVTDNWNCALEKSSGEYVIMLGDDDALRDGYFKRVLSYIQKYDSPDFIYSSAYLFVYPNVIPKNENGMLHFWANASFFVGKREPFFLDENSKLNLVKQTLKFIVAFNYNFQFSLVKKSFISELRNHGSFFQSPYPDYYATTAMFLKAKRVLAVPDPLVIVGVCPKSFGWYWLNDKESQGISFLNNDSSKFQKNLNEIFLPGTGMNDSWLQANQTIKENFSKEYDLKVDYRKYRFLQILHHLKKYSIDRKFPMGKLWEIEKFLNSFERIYFYVFLLLAVFIRCSFRHKHRTILIHKLTCGLSHPDYGMKRIDGEFIDILKVSDQLGSL
jgi:glycosyltransferase involved in cell wall biosynthesis